MCGILCCFEILKSQKDSTEKLSKPKDDNDLYKIFTSLQPETINRGPDYVSPVLNHLFIANNDDLSLSVDAHFFSTVLSLRSPFTKQPIIRKLADSASNFNTDIDNGCDLHRSLCVQFNGELYNEDIEGNDTSYFSDGFLKALKKPSTTSQERVNRISEFLTGLKGEYAFVVTDTERKEVWFARDSIGKRSLVCHRNVTPIETEIDEKPINDSSENSEEEEKTSGSAKKGEEEEPVHVGVNIEGEIDSGIVLSSVSGGQFTFDNENSDGKVIQTSEVPAGKLFKMDLNSGTIESYSWELPGTNTDSRLIYPFGSVNLNQLSDTLQPERTTELLEQYDKYTVELDKLLLQATKRRLDDVPYIEHKKPTLDESIVSSQAEISIQNTWTQSLPAARLAVLFSGGIDCSLVAHYIAKLLQEDEKSREEPIDLLNVAFHNPRKEETKQKEKQQQQKKQKEKLKKNKKNKKHMGSNQTSEISKEKPVDEIIDEKHVAEIADEKTNNDTISDFFEMDEKYETPDRLLGRRAWLSLSEKYPNLRFVEINIPYEETHAHKQRVSNLMFPSNSVMDFSIAVAFYFASRGSGTLYFKNSDSNKVEKIPGYSTTANVLFSGLGADELFGGYSRHAKKIEYGIKDMENGVGTGGETLSYKELAKELQIDFSRLDSRNLGRDDRVCSSWARELRYVFLDEDVVNWAMKSCPLDMKINTSKPVLNAVNDLNIDEKLEPEKQKEKLPSSQAPNKDHHLNPKPVHIKKQKKKKEPKQDSVITKFVLRRIAHMYGSSSGLGVVEHEKKRAIQFGARTAKMEKGSGKSKGTDKLEI